MGVNSLPKTVTRQRRGCDLNPGPSAPESSTLTTRLPSHPIGTTLLLIPPTVGCVGFNPESGVLVRWGCKNLTRPGADLSKTS